jgi:hypothetical protein
MTKTVLVALILCVFASSAALADKPADGTVISPKCTIDPWTHKWNCRGDPEPKPDPKVQSTQVIIR